MCTVFLVFYVDPVPKICVLLSITLCVCTAYKHVCMYVYVCMYVSIYEIGDDFVCVCA
jgi:hypothetical protein